MGIDYDFFLAPYGNSHVCKKKNKTYFFNKMIRFCFSSRQDHTIGEAQEHHNTDENNWKITNHLHSKYEAKNKNIKIKMWEDASTQWNSFLRNKKRSCHSYYIYWKILG